MATRQLSGRQPLCFAGTVHDLSFFLFLHYRRLISLIAWPIVTKLCRMFEDVIDVQQDKPVGDWFAR